MVGLHGGDRACHVALLDGTVTDHDHIVEKLGVGGKNNLGRNLGSPERLCLVADAADFDSGIRAGNVKDVVSVETGRDTVLRALFHDSGTDDRTGGVDYNSLHLIPALSGYGSADQAKKQGRHGSYNPFHLECLNCLNIHLI